MLILENFGLFYQLVCCQSHPIFFTTIHIQWFNWTWSVPIDVIYYYGSNPSKTKLLGVYNNSKSKISIIWRRVLKVSLTKEGVIKWNRVSNYIGLLANAWLSIRHPCHTMYSKIVPNII